MHPTGRRQAELHRALAERRYRPEGYRLTLIHEPKRRLIAAAGVRDRVVHQAVHQVLSPLLDRGLIDTTYACLEGRGSHRAVLGFQQGLRRYPFVLLLDIRGYFLSIDQGILLDLMARRLKERPLLGLLARIAPSREALARLGSKTAARVRAGMDDLERSLAASRGVVLGPFCKVGSTNRDGLSQDCMLG